METEACAVERTYFVPLSGLDAANYLVIASQIKLATHPDVSAEYCHFVEDLRSVVALHKQSTRTVVTEDGSVRKSTSRVVIQRMDDLLRQLDDAGLRLCFRMWSGASSRDHVKIPLADGMDSDGVSADANRTSEDSDYGAVVAFLIVPQSLPVTIPESGNGHSEICMDQVPDWDALPNELAGA